MRVLHLLDSPISKFNGWSRPRIMTGTVDKPPPETPVGSRTYSIGSVLLFPGSLELGASRLLMGSLQEQKSPRDDSIIEVPRPPATARANDEALD